MLVESRTWQPTTNEWLGLQPDDVTFLKPVTVTIQIDESKKHVSFS